MCNQFQCKKCNFRMQAIEFIRLDYNRGGIRVMLKIHPPSSPFFYRIRWIYIRAVPGMGALGEVGETLRTSDGSPVPKHRHQQYGAGEDEATCNCSWIVEFFLGKNIGKFGSSLVFLVHWARKKRLKDATFSKWLWRNWRQEHIWTHDNDINDINDMTTT